MRSQPLCELVRICVRIPGQEQHRKMALSRVPAAEQLVDNRLLVETVVVLECLEQNMLRLLVRNLAEHSQAYRIVWIVQDRVRTVGEPRFVKTHEIAHQTDVHKIDGMGESVAQCE